LLFSFACIFNKNPPFLPPICHWANYTYLNKTFSLERKEAENRGKSSSQKLGEPQPKTGAKLRPILMPNLRG